MISVLVEWREDLMMSIDQDRNPERAPFGRWLVDQKGRGGFVGHLATAAASERGFPRDGDVEAARKWLQEQRPSGDDWEAVEDAESAWLAS